MDGDDGSKRPTSGENGKPTVLVVEPLALFGECLRLALEVGGFAVLGQARTLKEAMAQLASQAPAAVVCDLDQPSGRNACREIARRYPSCSLIAISGRDSPEALGRAQAAGAAVIVSKHSGLPALLAALSTAPQRGGMQANGEPGNRPLAQIDGESSNNAPLQTLSAREREVARLIGRGLTNKEVARLLRVAPVTVRNHLSNAMGKLGARSRAEVAAIVALAGWLNDTVDQ